MSPVAIVWPCPLAVDAYAAADRDLGFPRPDCPSCAGPLVFWPGSRRYVREAGRSWKIFVPRLRCARCGVSHALLPAFTPAWRLDVAETIGSVVGEVVAGQGCEVRPAAERAGCRIRPPAAGSAGSGPVPRSWAGFVAVAVAVELGGQAVTPGRGGPLAAGLASGRAGGADARAPGGHRDSACPPGAVRRGGAAAGPACRMPRTADPASGAGEDLPAMAASS